MDGYDDFEWKDNSDEEDADNPEEEQRFVIEPSYLLIAIDVGSASDSLFADCLEALYKVYDTLVSTTQSAVRGPISIILANNDLNKATFIDFEQSIPDIINFLKSVKKASAKELKDKYAQTGKFDLGEFFLFCKNKLTSITCKTRKKTVYYLTNDDDAVKDDKIRFKILNEAQKFGALDINLYVGTFKKDFVESNLYSEVLSESRNQHVRVFKDVEDLTGSILKFTRRDYVKYPIKFYPFQGEKAHLRLVINKIVKKAKTLKNMFVTRDTQKEVKRFTRGIVIASEFQMVEPSLSLNRSEKEILTETNVSMGYTLLYVGNENSRTGWLIERPSLIEKHRDETSVLFDAFWNYCRENSKCLVCIRKYRKGGRLRFLELAPRLIDDKHMFLGRAYPFSNEIYYTPKDKPAVEFSREENETMELLVNELTFKYQPRMFKDPVESKRKAYIKSQLLGEQMEEIEDGVPSDAVLDDNISHCVNEFRRLNLLEESTGKRTAAPRGGRAKRGK